MNRRRALAAAAALTATACAAERRPRADGLARRVDDLLQPMAAGRTFSGAVALARGNVIVYARGWGIANRETGTPFGPDTPSDGGSIAKTFTAALVHQLVHEGRLALDAPAARWVPEFPHPATTLRHLIAHCNGLPPQYEFFDPHFPPGAIRTTPALLAVVARHAPQPSFVPGTRFEYCDLGYDVAALIAERATGRTYARLVQERFFGPLGLASSFARPARLVDWRGVRTRGYRWKDGAWQDEDAFDGEAFLGASNLYFSAHDLARWGLAFANGRALSPAVDSAGSVRPVIDSRPSPLDGLNWTRSADGRQGHCIGSVQAFHAFVHWDRDRRCAAAFVRNVAAPPEQTELLQRALVDALAQRRPAV